jgi:uridine kinase
MDVKPYIIGVSGGSASGKTYLLNQLLNNIPASEITLVSQDNYYHEFQFQKKKDDGTVNFDHPDALDLDRFSRDIHTLLHGHSVTLKEYTFNNPNKIPKMITYLPTKIIVLEGLFIFYLPELNQIIDLKIFVDAEEHIKLSRRILRDHSERGYQLQEILRQYQEDVVPMYNLYVKPGKEICDIIIPNNQHMDKAIEILLDHLRIKSL